MKKANRRRKSGIARAFTSSAPRCDIFWRLAPRLHRDEKPKLELQVIEGDPRFSI
jgi:hypothetical protein